MLLQHSPTYETFAWGRELEDALQEGTNTNKTVLPGSTISCPVHQCPLKPCTVTPSPAPSCGRQWAALRTGPAPTRKIKRNGGPFPSQGVMLPQHSPPCKAVSGFGERVRAPHSRGGPWLAASKGWAASQWRGSQRLPRRNQQHPELLPPLFHPQEGNYHILPSLFPPQVSSGMLSDSAAELRSSRRDTPWEQHHGAQHPAPAEESRSCHAEARGPSQASLPLNAKQRGGFSCPNRLHHGLQLSLQSINPTAGCPARSHPELIPSSISFPPLLRKEGCQLHAPN